MDKKLNLRASNWLLHNGNMEFWLTGHRGRPLLNPEEIEQICELMEEYAVAAIKAETIPVINPDQRN